MPTTGEPGNIFLPDEDSPGDLETLFKLFGTSVNEAFIATMLQVNQRNVPSVADKDERDELNPSPQQGDRVYRIDRGYEEIYCNVINQFSNRAGAVSPGWWPSDSISLPVTGDNAPFVITNGWTLDSSDGLRPNVIYRDDNRIYGNLSLRKINNTQLAHGEAAVTFKPNWRPRYAVNLSAHFNSSPSQREFVVLAGDSGTLTLLTPPGGVIFSTSIDFTIFNQAGA